VQHTRKRGSIPVIRVGLLLVVALAASGCGEFVTGTYGESVEIAVTPLTLVVGGRADVIVRWHSGDGPSRPVTGGAVQLRSSDPRIVRVERLQVVGVAPGVAYVRAEVARKADSVLVTVE
jgi:hypothetical protein